MLKEDCFYLGKVVKKHSFRGEVVIKLDTDEPTLYKNMKSVFVESNDCLIPFFIKKSSLSKSTMLRVHFDGVNSEEEANSIMKANIYLPLDLLPKLEGNQFYFHEIIGFSIVDQVHGEVGVLVAVNDKAAQPLFEIKKGSSEVLIPIVDNFIKKIDRKNKRVHVLTPEGLIDLYLN